MEVDIQLSSGIDKEQTYQELIPQLEAYFSGGASISGSLMNWFSVHSKDQWHVLESKVGKGFVELPLKKERP